jgi:hypothetical protein
MIRCLGKDNMKTIGVFTKNFTLYYELLNLLKKRKIPYVSLNSFHNIPSKIGVILTSNNEIHDMKLQKVIAADAYDTIDHAIDLAIQLLIGKELYSKLFIGIDPGEKPGIAVIGDDIILQKINVETPENVINIIKRIIKEYPSNETLIRIGHGSPIIRNRIINSLIPLEIPIEIVDETKTNPQQQAKKYERDTKAAAAIALIRGGKVQRKLPLEPKKGEIKNLQEKSRKLTDGELSISEKTALKVLKGEIGLEEAIKLEKNNTKNRKKN